MGLIKAITGAVGGVLADQWKEFFYCDALGPDVLVAKGIKRVGGRSSNTKANDNIISKGSGIAVADGQCMIIVEQGKVVEVCAEPGEFTYDSSTEPSIFAGNLGDSIIETFKIVGRRFTYGGDTGKDQRVYYFNTKEIYDNKFGTATPIPFRVVDTKIGLDLDTAMKCNGIYSYRIADPLLFYTNVCGNVEANFGRIEIDNTLKSEFIDAIRPAIGEMSNLEIRPNQISAHCDELKEAVNRNLAEKWAKLRGLEVVNIAINSATIPEEDEKLIKEAQKTAMLKDPTMAAATVTGAYAEAMKGAATNENGAMTGFMGMGMLMNNMGASGMNPQNLYTMGQQQNGSTPNGAAVAGGVAAADTWKCACGATASGKFCAECGAGKPADADGWTCTCGAVNKGKFCSNCGGKKPAGAPIYRCDKCGWEPEDPKNPPKFCPECGDPFDDNDIQ